MLKSISIKNFKSIRELDIELSRVNVFIGENGCGKTSILEAMGMAGAILSNKLDNEFLVSRGIRVPALRLMKSGFTKVDAKAQITLKLTNAATEFVEYKVDFNKGRKNLELEDAIFSSKIPATDDMVKEFLDSFKNSETMKKDFISRMSASTSKATASRKFNKILEDMVSTFITEKFQESAHKSSKMTTIYNQNTRVRNEFNVANFLIYTPENYFLRRFEEEGQISPIGVRGEGLFRHLVQLFKEDPAIVKEINSHLKLISWFDGLEIPEDLSFSEMRLNIKDRFIKDTIEFFDQRSANEGFLYLLFYFTLFLSKDTPELFAIDNIDNALNPKLCRELVQRLSALSQRKSKQVILTTHNPAILDGLDLKDDSHRLFVVYRNGEGHTKVKRVKAPTDIKGIETVRLSEAFIRGYIGGLPKNFL